MAPKAPVFGHLTIRAGDAIVASVVFSPRTRAFTLSLTDATNGQHLSPTAACPAGSSCARSSAEAISEAPLGPHGFLPLADFRAAAYSSVQVAGQAGHQGGLRAHWWDTAKITTVSQQGQVPGPPTALFHGAAFGIYWLRER